MSLRVAFMGFRHAHILAVYEHAKAIDDVEIVAACEEDAATREKMSGGKVAITHNSYDKMLEEADCDAIAIGDYYGKRGSITITALEHGKHVISDKPLCTSLSELDRIEELVGEKGVCVCCQFDMRNEGKYLALRRSIRDEDMLGEIHAVSFGGQHPLLHGTRPGWYFEEGKHGGTINDIAVHAIDLVPWVTGRKFTTVNAARNWNAVIAQVPHFKDSAQLMLTMANGCGVLGDVSYLAPDSFGYELPMYWRYTFWGQHGVIELDNAHDGLMLCRNGESEIRIVQPERSLPGGYFRSFVREISGEAEGLSPSTKEVLSASRVALAAQDAADRDITQVAL